MNKQLLKLIYKLKDTVSGGNRVILYINGSEILPKPLDPQMEAECLATLGKNPKSEQLLIEHNLRLVVFIAKKFETATAGLEDLISIGTIGLIKAIHTFRTDKNIKLATYASRCIENEILMYLRKMGNSRQDLSIDEPLNVDWEGNELLLCDILSGEEDTVYQSIEQDEDRRLIRTAIQKLEPREQTIINLRYGITNGKEKTQKEVADMLGISQSYISRLEKKIIKSLRDKLSSNF